MKNLGLKFSVGGQSSGPRSAQHCRLENLKPAHHKDLSSCKTVPTPITSVRLL